MATLAHAGGRSAPMATLAHAGGRSAPMATLATLANAGACRRPRALALCLPYDAGAESMAAAAAIMAAVACGRACYRLAYDACLRPIAYACDMAAAVARADSRHAGGRLPAL